MGKKQEGNEQEQKKEFSEIIDHVVGFFCLISSRYKNTILFENYFHIFF
jgi:hypothetical protein